MFSKSPVIRDKIKMLTFAKIPTFWDYLKMKATTERHPKLASYAEALQAKGRYWFTKAEATKSLKISEPAFNKAAIRLARQTKIARIKNGFYTIIPPEFRNTKSLPATYFIDALMQFQKQPYYIGVLSAASLHGAAHQSPQELQVVTSRPLKLIEIGSARIRFLTKKDIESTPTLKMKTPTGYINVSTIEATILDLLRYVRIAGHLDNVTTAVAELIEHVNSGELIKIAESERELSYVQRLGFLLDQFSLNKILSRGLHKLIEKRKPPFVYLRPDQRAGITEKNQKWNVFVNTSVEPDL